MFLDRLFESRIAKGIGLLGTIIGLAVGAWQIFIWIK